MKQIYAKDYAILPDTDACQIERVRRMLAEHPADTQFIFTPGRYHFYLENAGRRHFPVTNSDQTEELRIAILLEHKENIVIDGQGAQFWFHGDLCPIAISECRQVCVRNFSIDFAVPPTAEAEILWAKQGKVVIGLDSGNFPYRIDGDMLIFEGEYGEEAPLFGAMEFEALTGKARAGAGDTFPRVRAHREGDGLISLEGNFPVLPRRGNILVLRHGKRIHPGILIQYSSQVCLESMAVHQTCGLGIVFQFNEDMKVSGTAFEPNRERGFRIFSGHDDGLHFSNNKGEILVEKCRFRGLMDDAVNVHGTAACLAEEPEGRKIRGAFRHPQSKGFPGWAKRGDRVGFLDPKTRACLVQAKVGTYRLLSEEEFEIELETEVPGGIAAGCALENLTNTPSFICRNSYFGSGRARGILVTTPKPVRIEDNVFETSGCAVLLAGDINEWYESGTCRDVEICRNEFRDCCTSKYQFCEGVIHVEPGVLQEVPCTVHENIRIRENTFFLASEALLYADHTKQLVIEKNRIFPGGGGQLPQFCLKACEEVTREAGGE